MNNTLCILPWVHFHISNHGDVLPCCIGTKPIQHISDVTDLDSIINHPSFKELRWNMLHGVKSSQCNECYTREANNLQSMRLRQMNNFHSNFNANADGSLDDFHLKFYDFRSNKICNMKCRMCSGAHSSRLAKEEIDLWANYNNANQTVDDKDLQKIEDIIKGEIEHIDSFYFAGGEPMIMKNHYDMLEYLISTNNTNKLLKYNSNLSELHFKGTNIIKLWKHFKNIKVGASIDAIDERAEYQRHGVKWSTIEDNIKEVLTNAQHVDLNITSVLSVFNSLHLHDAQMHLIKNVGVDPSKLTFMVTPNPDYIDIKVLPQTLKDKFIERTNTHITELKNINGTQNLCSLWENAIQYINSAYISELQRLECIAEFKEFNNALDNHRKESFNDVYPELKEL